MSFNGHAGGVTCGDFTPDGSNLSSSWHSTVMINIMHFYIFLFLFTWYLRENNMYWFWRCNLENMEPKKWRKHSCCARYCKLHFLVLLLYMNNMTSLIINTQNYNIKFKMLRTPATPPLLSTRELLIFLVHIYLISYMKVKVSLLASTRIWEAKKWQKSARN